MPRRLTRLNFQATCGFFCACSCYRLVQPPWSGLRHVRKGRLGLASWVAAGLISEAWISPCFQRDARIEVQLTIGLQADPEQFFALLLSPCSQAFLGRTVSIKQRDVMLRGGRFLIIASDASTHSSQEYVRRRYRLYFQNGSTGDTLADNQILDAIRIRSTF